MLLKSSSTPILGSLLSSSTALLCESPNNDFHYHHSVERTTPSSSSIPHGISCRVSRLFDSSERGLSTGMRRTRSEGNIQDLPSNCSDGSQSKSKVKPSFAHHSDPALETCPSFPLYNPRIVYEDEEENLKDEYQIAAELGFLEHGVNNRVNLSWQTSQPLFLARGLGIDRLPSGFMNLGSADGGFIIGGDGSGRDGNCPVKTDYGGEGYEMDMYYKRALDEDPSNALILKNYAQFLYQYKGDLLRAEEYYSRAILADPVDADTILQYGKLVWELHGDQERALAYIERAANMEQSNCFVQAAYASFLWETEEED